ncbi:MAG: serine hydrolase [Anaerolineae bacterium]|jgi:CubicO group peptidase (beta-lactamase class C family)
MNLIDLKSTASEPLAGARGRRRSWPLFTSALLILSILGSSILVGCGGPSAEELEAVDYTPLPGDDWQVSTPAEQGLDPLLVAQLYSDASELERLYGLLVVKDGHLIAEKYFHEGSIEQKARIQSVTKSVTSALVGIALERECLSSVEQKMLDSYPEVAGQITDPRKEQITLRQMLQMRAGFPWEESHADLWDGLLSGRYVPLIEAFPLVTDPGTEFHYSNLTSNWLGIIVDRACGKHLRSYAIENLFSPMGVEAGTWGTDWEGHNNGCGDLHLRARDMAKFGLLYLNEGEYEGSQIIPADWVRDSLQTYSEDAWDNIGRFRDIGYGYHWWSARAGDHRVNFAWGHGGQLIVLVDEFDIVVVTTTDPFYLQHDGDSWKHEKATISLVADFVASLPSE